MAIINNGVNVGPSDYPALDHQDYSITGLEKDFQPRRRQGDPSFPGNRQNAFYCGLTAIPSAVVATPSINLGYFTPFYLPNVIINRIAIEVTTALAGAARVGIYTNDYDTGMPDRLIFEAGTLDTGTVAAIVEAAFADFKLPAEIVWIVATFTAAAGVRSGIQNNTHLIGGSTIQGISRALTATLAAASALPQRAPAIIGGAASGIPLVAVRKV